MNVNGFDITIGVYKSRSFQEHKGSCLVGTAFRSQSRFFCNSKFRIAVLHPFSPCAIIRTCSGGDDWPRLFWQNLSSFGISSCSSLTWHTIESAWQKVLFFWNTTLVEVFWLRYTCRSFLIVFSAAKAAYRLKWIEVPGLLSAGTPCDNNISPVCHFQSCWIVLERKETFKMKAFLLFAVKWIKVENVFYSLSSGTGMKIKLSNHNVGHELFPKIQKKRVWKDLPDPDVRCQCLNILKGRNKVGE